MVFGWQEALDRLLAAEGYATRDETLILAAPAADIAEAPPPVSCFEIWPPLAVQEEIWDAGGIGPARRAIMRRAEGPKTALFGRINDRPAAEPPSSRFMARSQCSTRSKWHRAHGATASPGS
jgi:hypothetical protein